MSNKSLEEHPDEEAQNQEQVIDCDEQVYYSPTSQKRLNFDDSGPMEDEEYEDDEHPLLTRSDAFMVHVRKPWGMKEPMRSDQYGEPSQESSSEDEEDKDLAWFFHTLHPDVDKYSQIAWCRTYANFLAAQMPKNRPKTYKKSKTN